MDLQQAIQFLDHHLEAFRHKKLTIAEQIALKAGWLDIRYDEAMGDLIDISPNYLSSRVAPELWKTLSDCFQQPLKKKNIRRFLETQTPISIPQPAKIFRTFPQADEQMFVGRQAELQCLGDLMGLNQCINVCGESGIGKSHLVRHLTQNPRWMASFEQVIWTSVCHAPSLGALCQTLLQELGVGRDRLSNNEVSLINDFFSHLKSKKLLIIIDSADMWISHQVNVDPLLRRACEELTQSVILVLSRSPFPILSALQTKRYPCRVFRLEGLNIEDAFKILEAYELQDPESWPQLIQKYRANPLALIQAAEMILSLFNGKVKQFIDLETTVVFETFEEAYRDHPFSPEEIQLLQVIQGLKQAKISEIIDACDQSHSRVIRLINHLLAHSFLDRHMIQSGYVYSVPPMLNKFLSQQLIVAGEQ